MLESDSQSKQEAYFVLLNLNMDKIYSEESKQYLRMSFNASIPHTVKRIFHP